MQFATKRQLIVSVIVFAALLIPISILVYIEFPKATCEDNRQNQGEEDVDCGGPSCVPCALKHPEDMRVFWARFTEFRSGQYDAVAEIRNPNLKLGASQFEYEFTFYDEAGLKVANRQGRSFMYPGELMHVVEPNIVISRKLSRVTFQITSIQWIYTDVIIPDVVVGDRKLSSDLRRKETVLEAELANRSFSDFPEVFVSAFVYDKTGTITAVSRVRETNVRSGESRKIYFAWPSVISEDRVSVTTETRVNTLPMVR